jgi:type I restriction enzyme S subunit
MNLPAYPKPKPSGTGWLGDVPDHWEVRRLNDVASLKTSNVDKKSVDGQSEVRLCNYVDVYYNDKITSNIEFMVATASKDEIEKFRLEKGDVVFTKDSESPFDIGIPALVDENIDDLVCGYHLAIIKASESELHGPFLFYALTAQPSVYQFTIAANGVTRFGLSQSGTKNIRVLVPSPDEQRSIAEFLDRKTGQIDELIGKKKELIQKLTEQRSALITAAVTGKLQSEIGNQKSPMVDSGVSWFGEIPEHWDVRRLKFSVSKVGSGVTPSGGASSYQPSGIPLLRSQNIHFNGLRLDDVAFIDEAVHESMDNSQVFAGDVLLNITGASIGRCYFFDGTLGEANVNQHVCIIRPEPGLLMRYLHYALWSDIGQLQIQIEQSGSGREGLNFAVLKNFIFPITGKDEQQAIVDYLDEKTGKIDGLIRKTETAIQTLEEYRTALITAAVTGKIDVRSCKINLSEK